MGYTVGVGVCAIWLSGKVWHVAHSRSRHTAVQVWGRTDTFTLIDTLICSICFKMWKWACNGCVIEMWVCSDVGLPFICSGVFHLFGCSLEVRVYFWCLSPSVPVTSRPNTKVSPDPVLAYTLCYGDYNTEWNLMFSILKYLFRHLYICKSFLTMALVIAMPILYPVTKAFVATEVFKDTLNTRPNLLEFLGLIGM